MAYRPRCTIAVHLSRAPARAAGPRRPPEPGRRRGAPLPPWTGAAPARPGTGPARELGEVPVSRVEFWMYRPLPVENPPMYWYGWMILAAAAALVVGWI